MLHLDSRFELFVLKDDFVMHFMHIIRIHACVSAHSTVKWLWPISAKSYASDYWHSHMTATNWWHEPTHVNCHVCGQMFMFYMFTCQPQPAATLLQGPNLIQRHCGWKWINMGLNMSFHAASGSNVEPDQPGMGENSRKWENNSSIESQKTYGNMSRSTKNVH